MKSLFKTTLLSVLTVATLTVSKPSQAVIGGVFSAPAVVTAGLVSLGTGFGMFGASVVMYSLNHNSPTSTGDALAFTSLLPGALGIVLLEDKQTLVYESISSDKAALIGLSSEEVSSFNSEIDQVNALASYVDSELGKLSRPSVKDSVAVWSSVQDAVSPETFSAMQKITAQLYK